ncbi:hypothetical protein CCL15_24215 [Pseudomonas syringae]|nr:hypothetical protein CCL15_24215 [Pseudomonas syringae]
MSKHGKKKNQQTTHTDTSQLGMTHNENKDCRKESQTDTQSSHRPNKKEGTNNQNKHTHKTNQRVVRNKQNVLNKIKPAINKTDTGHRPSQSASKPGSARKQTQTNRLTQSNNHKKKPRKKKERQTKNNARTESKNNKHPAAFIQSEQRTQRATHASDSHSKNDRPSDKQSNQPTSATSHYLPASNQTNKETNDRWRPNEVRKDASHTHGRKQPTHERKNKTDIKQSERNTSLPTPQPPTDRPPRSQTKQTTAARQTAAPTRKKRKETHTDTHGPNKRHIQTDSDRQTNEPTTG